MWANSKTRFAGLRLLSAYSRFSRPGLLILICAVTLREVLGTRVSYGQPGWHLPLADAFTKDTSGSRFRLVSRSRAGRIGALRLGRAEPTVLTEDNYPVS